MSLFTYVLLFILFVLRIYGTKTDINYSEWKKIIEENCKSFQEVKETYNQEVWNVFNTMFFILTHLYFIFLVGVFIIINKAVDMQIITILSAIQILTVFVHYYYWLKTPLCSTKVEDYKFRAGWNWFNVILDYIYCPLVFICGLVG